MTQRNSPELKVKIVGKASSTVRRVTFQFNAPVISPLCAGLLILNENTGIVGIKGLASPGTLAHPATFSFQVGTAIFAPIWASATQSPLSVIITYDDVTFVVSGVMVVSMQSVSPNGPP